jgi:c-di-GMP phosphodiesterase
MATIVGPNATGVLADLEPGHGSQERMARYFARQPILKADGEVFGYELLFRSAREDAFRGDGNMATRTMLDNSVMFGIEKLTPNLPAFINCTLDALTTALVEVLPPDVTVLEILESVEPTPELIQACRDLKGRGFRLAMDDFAWKPHVAPLAEIADFIKIDFMISDRKERAATMEQFKRRRPKFIAEKIETKDDFKRAQKEGFTLFQGYYFCRPTLVERGDIPANKMAQLKLLHRLQQQEFDPKKMSKLVEQDAGITYRLLRLVNSAMFAYRRRVRSVETALIVVGEKAFRQIATLAITSALSRDNTPALLRMALVRARFCELAAPLCGLDGTEQYLLGLFSLLSAMLRVPMEQAIAPIEMRDEMRQALLGKTTSERNLLCWMEASERGDWSTCSLIETFHHIHESKLSKIAAEAAQWADAVLN